jgi:tRNA nucleotidyltransferase (CCA-adding enzyme)
MNQHSKTVEKKILKIIVPTAEQRKTLESAINELKICVQKIICVHNYPITLQLVGSTEKDTYLKDNLDIDLFLCFPASVSKSELQKIGLSIGRKVLTKTEECFAEHPYLRGMFQGFKTEIVPCYTIESTNEKISAVDRTPFHTRYVKKHLKESQKNEVRLLKQFLIGIGCYGAEAEIEGFSGYLCELLILKYSSFYDLLTHAQEWSYGITLSLHNVTHPLFDTPLVFIDPVDSERNVSSALSKEKFDFFITTSSEYLKNPRESFFFPKLQKPWSLSKIKEHIGDRKIVGIKIKKPEIISENLYPQVRKAMRAIIDLSTQYGFEITDAFFHVGDAFFYIVLFVEDIYISPTIIHIGPPVNLYKNSEEFLEKWTKNSKTIKQPYEKNNRWYVEIQREYVDIRDLLKNQLLCIGLGKHIDRIIKDGFILLDKTDLLDTKYCMLWTKYLDTTMSWDR